MTHMTILDTVNDSKMQMDMNLISDEIKKYRLAGDLEGATKLCTKATELFPNDFFFFKILFDLLLQQKKYDATFFSLGNYLNKMPSADNKYIAGFATRYHRLRRVLSKEKILELADFLCSTIDQSTSINQMVAVKVKTIISSDMVSSKTLVNQSKDAFDFIRLLDNDSNFNALIKLEKNLETENLFQLKQVLDEHILTRKRDLNIYRIDLYCASLYEKFGESDKAIRLLTELLSLRIDSVAVRSLFRICRTIKNYDSVDAFLSKNPSLIKKQDFNILYELVYYFEAKNDTTQLQRVLYTIEKSFAQNRPILQTLKNFYIRFGMLDELKRLESVIRSLSKAKNKSTDKYVEELEESETEIASTVLELYSELEHHKQLAAISDLTTGISHELGQPITNIRYTIQFYKKLLDKNLTKEGVFKIFDSILEETERMGALIKRLSPLTSSRNILETFDLVDRISKRVQLESPRLNDNHINVSISPKSPIILFGDPVKFDQLISNLLLNAIDAIAECRKTGQNKIDIKIKNGVQNVHLLFSDNGIGIPFKNQNKIFDPFFSTKAPGKGEGLGLFIVWNLLKSQGGKITVDNNYTSGARFVITIPKKLNLEKEAKS